MKTGTKGISAIKESTKNIENLTNLFKRRRLSKEEYISSVNKNLSNMSDERDYIDYLKNIGQY